MTPGQRVELIAEAHKTFPQLVSGERDAGIVHSVIAPHRVIVHRDYMKFADHWALSFWQPSRRKLVALTCEVCKRRRRTRSRRSA